MDPKAPHSPQSILDFWFGNFHPDSNYLRERGKLWFGADPKTDQEIQSRFESSVELAASGELTSWEDDAVGALALLLLLDQFSLNIYRNQARGYLLSDEALPIALRALDRGFPTERHPVEKAFFYLPLEHAENVSLQQQSVFLFSELYEEVKGTFWAEWAKGSLDWAKRHLDVVEKFGRFPHRNEALGRISTEAELTFLKAGRPF